MKLIELNRGYFAKVDDEDYHWLVNFNWRVMIKRLKPESARAWTRVSRGVKKDLQMHRLVLGETDPKRIVDHINRDPLDNQKSNLRVCTIQQNLCNSAGNFDRRFSKYKGVSYHPQVCRTKRWTAQLRYKGKVVLRGFFLTELEAAVARDAAALKFCGEYAYINLPELLEKNTQAI